MIIKKFRIWNYRSIVDSGDCYPVDTVTILAGKNESGKSSILQALEDFDTGRLIREKAVPIEGEGTPKITIWFQVGKADIDQIFEEIDFSCPAAVPDEIEVCLTKHYPNQYDVSSEFLTEIGLDTLPYDYTPILQAKYDRVATTTITEVATRLSIPFPSLDTANLESALKTFEKYSATIQPHLGNWSATDQKLLTAGLKALVTTLDEAANDPASWLHSFVGAFIGYVPNFILFSSFEDIFPNEIPLTELGTDKWIADLREMSDINIDTISGTNQRAKKSHKTELNLKLNDDFGKFWTQDLSRLSVDWDNEKLYFWIEENGAYYEPEIRSQGRRWHLAFYIRISARARENVQNIILIDEPGLYLHANAQRDVLRNLEDASTETQVIFSTHSPYLIEPEKLDRVRLVRKMEGSGTVIENKLHAVGDKETLTPILTAIGLELNRGIVAANRKNNVIVEGPSDYFYLTGLNELMEKSDLNFVSGGGSGNMPKVGTILQGWGCQVVYLYDNDKAYKEALKHVKNEWLAITKEMLEKLPIEGAIEDLFSRDDFAVKILGVAPGEIAGRNSEHVNGKDKVLTARQFLNSIRTGDPKIALDEKTMMQAKKLFSELRKKFENYQY